MNKKTIIAFLVVAVTIALGILIAFTGSSKEEVSRGSETKTESVKREDAFYKGNKGAKVEIVEFSDFQCPACKMSAPVVKEVVKFYGDKIVFYYRHFPLPQHKLSKDAALASEAAGLQGKFWEMADLIFENQSSLTNTSFNEFAKLLGLDMAKFESDVRSEDTKKRVEEDLSDAKILGVNSTPTFYINGEKIEGGLTFEDWKKVIDKKLAEIGGRTSNGY